MVSKLYIFLGFLCIALGTIGIFLPLLPTTPFLLAAIFFFMRSSKKWVRYIMRNKYLSPYVYGYLSKRGIPMNVMFRAITILWLALSFSFTYATDNLYIRTLLIFIGISVTIHLWTKRAKY